jgi:acyl-CoA dehydrogenase
MGAVNHVSARTIEAVAIGTIPQPTRSAPVPPFEAEHEAFRIELRDWIRAELRPRVDAWERDEWFDGAVFGWLAARGWLGLSYPAEYGGGGKDRIWGAVMSEELARCGSGGLAAGIGAHIGIALPPIATFGTEAQKQRWLVPGLRAEKIAALAITEPGAGSDVASIRTRAERVDGGWRVNGAKTFITNGVRADLYVTAVRTTPEGGHHGTSFLVIEKGDGVTASPLHKLGWNASDTGEIAFADVFVPEDHLLGEENRGFHLIMANFQGERLGMALVALGEMRETFEYTVQRLVERGGTGQATRHRVAELATSIEAVAALTYGTLRRHAAGMEAVREVSMAKLLSQRANLQLQEACMYLLGVEGALVETGIERKLRDARLGPIGGGTDEIMKEILGKTLGL